MRLGNHGKGLSMEPKLLRFETARFTDRVRMSLIGELDLSTSPELIERLAEVVQGRPAYLDLDLSQLTYADSVGFSVFVTAHFQCRDAGIELRFLNPNLFLMQLLATTGLDQVLTIASTGALVGA
jgi:anti-anti-sigma factor